MNEWYEIVMFVGVFAFLLILARRCGVGCGSKGCGSGGCGLSNELPERTLSDQQVGPKDAQRSNRGES